MFEFTLFVWVRTDGLEITRVREGQSEEKRLKEREVKRERERQTELYIGREMCRERESYT